MILGLILWLPASSRAQNGSVRFVAESSPDVTNYLAQIEQLYRQANIDAALALLQIASPLIEEDANRLAATELSAELAELRTKQSQAIAELPKEIDKVEDYINDRFNAGLSAIDADDNKAARDAFMFTWLAGGNYRESRDYLDRLDAAQEEEAATAMPAEAMAPDAPAAVPMAAYPEVDEVAELMALAKSAEANGDNEMASMIYGQVILVDPANSLAAVRLSALSAATAAPMATPDTEPVATMDEAPAVEEYVEVAEATTPEAPVEIIAESAPEPEVVEAPEQMAEETPSGPTAEEIAAAEKAAEAAAAAEAEKKAEMAAADQAAAEKAAAEKAEAEKAAETEAELKAQKAAEEKAAAEKAEAEKAAAAKKAEMAAADQAAADQAAAEKAAADKAAAEQAAAEQAAKEQAAKRERDAGELIDQAEQARTAKEYQKALTLYARALELSPGNTRALIGQADAQINLDIQNQLEGEMAERVAATQAESSTMMSQAEASFAAGNFDEAIATATAAADIDPNLDIKPFVSRVEAARATRETADRQAQIDSLMASGESAYDSGDYAAAVASFASAAQLDPENSRIQSRLEKAESVLAKTEDANRSKVEKEQSNIAQTKYRDGVEAYRSGDIEEARRLWTEALEIRDDYQEPRIRLQETDEEWQEYSAERAREALAQSQERDAIEKLETRVSLSTPRTIPLVDILNTLSLVSGINYSIQGGVDAQLGVNARFEEQPLHEVLDNILTPNGLRWERKGDIIVITADLTTEVFSLSDQQAQKVRVLIDSGHIDNLLNPPGSTKVSGKEVRLDDRRNILILTDSQQNIQRLAKVLDNLQREAAPELIFRTFVIPERQGPELKALLENVLKVGPNVPVNLDRRILLDGDTLIVKDTPENVARAEELLLDKALLRNLDEDKLGIRTFSLLPREELENTEQLQAFGEQVVEVISTFLYAESGIENARKEGRRLWYDPAMFQLTVVDRQSNLREVAEFIASLPQLAQEERFEFKLLRHGDAGEIAGQINSFLGIETGGPTTGGTGGDEVTRSVRVDGSLEFRDITIRVLRVNENDVSDDNDDSVEMVVRSPTESRDVTLEEFRSEFIGDYELVALEIRPSGTTGEGSVRLQVRFAPAGGVQGGGDAAGIQGGGAQLGGLQGVGAQGAPGAPLTAQQAVAARGAENALNITVDPVESLNALLIRYTDVSLYNRVLDLIEALDIAVPQVSIATNFVEVNETRAKEFSSEFGLQNILNDDFEFSDGDLNAGFGLDSSELRSVFEPPIEFPLSAGLLKGSTDVTFDFGALSGRLRFLESEGILNVVTGPQVTVQSGQSATFQITLFSAALVTTPSTTQDTNSTGGSRSVDLVELDVSPTVTQLGSITLDLDVRLQEIIQDTGVTVGTPGDGGLLTTGSFSQGAGTTGTATNNNTGTTTGGGTGNFVGNFPRAIGVANNWDFTIKEKELTTRARVQDGGTIVLGGFTGERSRDLTSGVPVLRNLPYIGKILFGRNLSVLEKTTMLIFLNANIVD